MALRLQIRKYMMVSPYLVSSVWHWRNQHVHISVSSIMFLSLLLKMLKSTIHMCQ